MTIIRVPSNGGSDRIGVILGTHPNPPNINIEIHRNGKLRFYWNNEIDLYGKSNLIDGKKHIIAFVRDSKANEIRIYLDGKLEIKTNKCGTDKIIDTKCFLFGRDYRNESVAFKEDILRMTNSLFLLLCFICFHIRFDLIDCLPCTQTQISTIENSN